MTALRLSFGGLDDVPAHHLSVDGMSPEGPNLSHWPGNRTPARFKADLSTGICLRFARAEQSLKEEFLNGVSVVLNDHYDTDGFLSLLAILRPEVAIAHEELCLAAAATGDFQTFQTARSFAVDHIVKNLAHPTSPVAARFAGLRGAELGLARYRWLLDNAETVLERPESLRPLYEDQLADVEEQLEWIRNGRIQRKLRHEAHLTVLATADDVSRMVLNTFAASFRVLHAQSTSEGCLFRYHDRTESWFEMVTIAPPPRRDLMTLAASLQKLEGNPKSSRWCADPIASPVPELYFGIPSDQQYGEVTRQLRPSRLTVDEVEQAFVDHFKVPR